MSLQTSGAKHAPGLFTADTDHVFAATIDTIRALPQWEVVSADPQSGEIHTLKRRRFRGGDHHRVLIFPDESGTAVKLERLDRRANPHQARADELDEILAGLERRVDAPRPSRR